jgi:hypothetical protein
VERCGRDSGGVTMSVKNWQPYRDADGGLRFNIVEVGTWQEVKLNPHHSSLCSSLLLSVDDVAAILGTVTPRLVLHRSPCTLRAQAASPRRGLPHPTPTLTLARNLSH